jgi:CubicO group peptidase (beta-lactamase class C family)
MSSFGRFQPLAAVTVCGVLVSLTVMSASAQQARSSESDFAAIDRFVEAERQATHVPSVTIGIVQGDHIVHLAGFGQADPTGRALTPQTPMLTASITKSFTALAVMQRVETGKVDLDAPIQRYLPWFALPIRMPPPQRSECPSAS